MNDDAPTSALDWENGQQVIHLLTETARDNGAMVLVVTHDHRLTPFADRVFELADGRLQSDTEMAPTVPATHDHTDAPRLRLYAPQG